MAWCRHGRRQGLFDKFKAGQKSLNHRMPKCITAFSSSSIFGELRGTQGSSGETPDIGAFFHKWANRPFCNFATTAPLLCQPYNLLQHCSICWEPRMLGVVCPHLPCEIFRTSFSRFFRSSLPSPGHFSGTGDSHESFPNSNPYFDSVSG